MLVISFPDQLSESLRVAHLGVVNLRVAVAVVFEGQRERQIHTVDQNDTDKVVNGQQQLRQCFESIFPHLGLPLPDKVNHCDRESKDK